MKKFNIMIYIIMLRIFNKRSKSAPQKNVHFDETVVADLAKASAPSPPSQPPQPPPRPSRQKNIQVQAVVRKSQQSQSPIKKWCCSWWRDIVQRARLDEIGKRSERLVKEQDMSQNIQHDMMNTARALAWEMHTIRLGDIDFSSIVENIPLYYEFDGSVRLQPTHPNQSVGCVPGCKYICEKPFCPSLGTKFYCVDKLLMLLSLPYTTQLSVFNLPSSSSLLRHRAETSFAFNGNKKALKELLGSVPVLVQAHQWIHPEPQRPHQPVLSDAQFVASWLVAASANNHTSDAFQIIQDLPHIGPLNLLYDNIRLLYPYKVDMPNCCKEFIDEWERPRQAETKCQHNNAKQCDTCIENATVTPLNKLLLKDLEAQLLNIKVVFFVNRITKEKTWKFVPGVVNRCTDNSQPTIAPPPIGEIMSMDIATADWIHPIRLDDPILKPSIADECVGDVVSAVSGLQEKLLVAYQEIGCLKKSVSRLEKLDAKNGRSLTARSVEFLEKRFNMMEKKLLDYPAPIRGEA